MTHCRYFHTTRKGNRSATLIPRVVSGRRPIPSEICAQSDPPPPFEKSRLRPISAHNVSTVGDKEKSSITTNIKSRAFQRAIDIVRTLPLSAPKGGSNSDFFAFYPNVTTLRSGLCFRKSVCRLSVYNVGAPYSGGWSIRQNFFTAVYAGHPLASVQNFTEIVLGEPLRRER